MRIRPVALVFSLLLVLGPFVTASPADARQDRVVADRTAGQTAERLRDIARDLDRLSGRVPDILEEEVSDAADQLRGAADRLGAGRVLGRVSSQIDETLRDLRSLRNRLEDRREDELANRMNGLAVRLAAALDDVDRMIEADSEARQDRNDAYPDQDAPGAEETRDLPWWMGGDRDTSRRRWQETRERRRDIRNRVSFSAPAFVGQIPDSWPYRQAGPYRTIPAVRYNRVEGLVLGVRRMPLAWDSFDRARIYGQVGYSFGLDDRPWRYEIGGEARLGQPYRLDDRDLKVGGSYHRNTTSDDIWKLSWTENTVGSFFFRQDYLDFFETEGWTAYAVARLSPATQLSVAYRADDYRSLANGATWALFGGDPFRANPGIDDGRMQSVVLAADGGRIRGYRSVPQGIAFRLEAELGSGFGGDFDFSRYTGDVHVYVRTRPDAGFAIRLRAGTSTGDLPLQKTFTLGGIGSVRAYPQNVFMGSRMALVNAEYALYGVDLLDHALEDITVFGLFDAGWTDGGTRRSFDLDDVIPAAGIGLGFGDRALRLELAWPLRDRGAGMEPTLWLRLNPTL